MTYTENLFVCIAAPLCVALLFLKGGARRFCGFLAAGMGVCLLAAFVNGLLVSVLKLPVDDAAVFVTPISEELLKLLPLLFYFLIFEPSDNDLFTAAVLIGIGFATFENCCFLAANAAESASVILVRGLAVGVMHTICALASGYGLVLLKRFRMTVGVGTLGVFAAEVTYHAVYNLLVSVPGTPRAAGYFLPLATTAGALFLFVLKRRREKNE